MGAGDEAMLHGFLFRCKIHAANKVCYDEHYAYFPDVKVKNNATGTQDIFILCHYP
jgi:hypothetical protein